MSETVVQIENLAKLYRLGQVGTGTIAHDLNRWWSVFRGKGDPFQQVGSANKRDEAGGSQYVWALKDVSFEVKQGEVLGIIGKNGAGKSTLLKLMSRVTAPTQGAIRLKGRVASLLEVGTGFHPELTGRENIFLNGAIMGMNRAEIRSRFDEIVDFSGCAKYVDTPVKRYSSGMFVRLAFAVAAHLEPEILIVDEVLAVGDADFQNRCIGKMKEVSEEGGRTVIFVSHNMASVKRLCSRGILLENGTMKMEGSIEDTVRNYLEAAVTNSRNLTWGGHGPESDEMAIREISVTNYSGSTTDLLTSADDVVLRVRYQLKRRMRNLRLCVLLRSADGVDIAYSSDFHSNPREEWRNEGEYCASCRVPANFFNRGQYSFHVAFDVPRERTVLDCKEEIGFVISELSCNQLGITLAPQPSGLIHPQFEWATAGIETT